MATINTYLYFKGSCEAAFNFYKSIFKKEFQYIGRYIDIPSQIREKYYPYCKDDQIMHITLPIGKETMLMGADLIQSDNDEEDIKKGFSLSIHTNSKDEAQQIFIELSKEGHIIVPISEQFWGSYYGLCVDKFGVSWKVNCISIH